MRKIKSWIKKEHEKDVEQHIASGKSFGTSAGLILTKMYMNKNELPDDSEILKNSILYSSKQDVQSDIIKKQIELAFFIGAKWMRQETE